MRLLVLETLILLDRIWSLPVENIGTVELKSSEKAVVFPLVFFGANAVVLPNTRFKDVKKVTDEESYIKGFMGCIADVVLSFTYYNAYCRDNVRLGAMFERG
ncbi:hypothetical protein EHEL_110020 [Encephalitozoon hellem ATCC 50504]|uniref:Uncharacterized protein n=1 Tax=Encephalitozoon hellem TaxID=27973 RepID=A0A9Q9C5T1_ENCHE|nr:uncharacterized protein EHEL_110020 [Encephalitozoon hellem ATCC 50504]AFM99278.1 hypothetical protein EHEL_110020 [Encephalitozoon hellem ATCC 50504]UTX43886.1 hypothetical protein GPU96_08g16620 [Encephalitozoon hellem]UTX44280.1 hypothetical protein GPU96_11g20760 [Encephalitozoon hellem]|eukprot:XP_003888259.1 hypothetical protein EHEL_110020 [Encephalitozoon hellem ATCC 50504]